MTVCKEDLVEEEEPVKMDESGVGGGHIQYKIGISLDDSQKEYWNLYTAENREKFFWLFLNSFVDKWQQQVNSKSK